MNKLESMARTATGEYAESKKVYYQIDAEMQEKADKFGVEQRKKYITKVNNPFGLIEGVLFTGAGVREALSKTKVNFMMSFPFEEDRGRWSEMYDYIRTVAYAIAYDTVVSAKGKLKGGEMFHTQGDVETNDLAYDEFFYDEEKHQIYRYEIII